MIRVYKGNTSPVKFRNEPCSFSVSRPITDNMEVMLSSGLSGAWKETYKHKWFCSDTMLRNLNTMSHINSSWYTPIRHTIMTTCLIIVGLPFAAKTALTHWDMDSTRPLKVCCGIWHQVVSSRSFKSCKLRDGASVDWTHLSSTPHRHSIVLKYEEFGGQVNTSILLLFL